MWNSHGYQINLIFLRHGKTKGNEEKRYIGRTDEELSEGGRAELFEIKDRITGYGEPELLYASPMRRCLQTAEILFPGKKPRMQELFRETDFGLFEGKNYQELSENALYQAWIDSNGEAPFPEGESREEVAERTLQGMKEMMEDIFAELQKKAIKEMTVAAVVHGGTIMSVLSGLYGGNYYDYHIGNGEGYLVRISGDPDCWKIISAEKIH